MADPFIIMSAPNGARRQKSDHPALPISPADMALCAEEIIAAGASILHLHVRDNQGAHCLDADRYRAATCAIRDAVGDDIIIQATSEAVGKYSRQQQIAMVKDLRPQAVSLALREIAPTDDDESEMAEFAQWLALEHIFPQYILYDEIDFLRFDAMRKRGVFYNDRPFTLFVLGNYQGTSTVNDIDQMMQCTEQATFPWAVCGFGPNEGDAVTHGAKNNGHIRVGFENNIWHTEGPRLRDHAQMIRFCSQAGHKENRTIASVGDVRRLFNI